ncbi:MAG: VTT domain-containing protein [Candidatus Taylorbacteria bacterium]
MHITDIINPQFLISTLGLLGVITIIFLETGAFFGFFFPGDSLLVTAGFFASQGHLSIAALLIFTFLAAVIGDSVGYAFGKKIGPSIFTKDDSMFFNKKYILRAQEFYNKHGRMTIILARFVPIVRTFAPIIAGVGSMKYRTFITFNIIGGLLWTWSMLLIGYGFGSIVPDPDRYIIPLVLVIIFISAAPGIYKLIQEYLRSLKSDS